MIDFQIDAGDTVLFVHPAGELLDHHQRYKHGMVADDDGGPIIGIAYLDMSGSEPARHYVRVPRGLVRLFYADEQFIQVYEGEGTA